MSRSAGHCMVMGTASTMTSLAEAHGTDPARLRQHPRRRFAPLWKSPNAAEPRIVEMVLEDLRPSQILTREAFENAMRVNMAIGGSTNAIIHLLAIAGRLGSTCPLSTIRRNLAHHARYSPTSARRAQYLMEDIFYAGGMPAVMKEIDSAAPPRRLTATGKSVGENVATARLLQSAM